MLFLKPQWQDCVEAIAVCGRVSVDALSTVEYCVDSGVGLVVSGVMSASYNLDNLEGVCRTGPGVADICPCVPINQISVFALHLTSAVTLS